jgi:ribosomal protein S18 acetylase RimI-like enzyme
VTQDRAGVIRDATPADAATLADLLNAIIREGDKTAIDTELSAEEFAEWFLTGAHVVSCVVAVDASGAAAGFQTLERFHDDLPPHAADIGTFVAAGQRGVGVGRALFAATSERARVRDIAAVRAVVRAENTAAVGAYRALGFAVDPDSGASTTLWWRVSLSVPQS